MTPSRIYCSGPLFCAEEVGGMSAIAQQLEQAGFQTFLPHRDGLEPYVMRLGNTPLPGALSGIRTRIDFVELRSLACVAGPIPRRVSPRAASRRMHSGQARRTA